MSSPRDVAKQFQQLNDLQAQLTKAVDNFTRGQSYGQKAGVAAANPLAGAFADPILTIPLTLTKMAKIYADLAKDPAAQDREGLQNSAKLMAGMLQLFLEELKKRGVSDTQKQIQEAKNAVEVQVQGKRSPPPLPPGFNRTITPSTVVDSDNSAPSSPHSRSSQSDSDSEQELKGDAESQLNFNIANKANKRAKPELMDEMLAVAGLVSKYLGMTKGSAGHEGKKGKFYEGLSRVATSLNELLGQQKLDPKECTKIIANVNVAMTGFLEKTGFGPNAQGEDVSQDKQSLKQKAKMATNDKGTETLIKDMIWADQDGKNPANMPGRDVLRTAKGSIDFKHPPGQIKQPQSQQFASPQPEQRKGPPPLPEGWKPPTPNK